MQNPACQRLAAALLAVFLVPPASAWNFATHRVIAAIAYDRLSPATRARVDTLIKLHPDYTAMFLKDAPEGEAARARSAFIAASTWADQIRSDPRFYDDGARGGPPTPTLAGFPDMLRHRGWHEIGLPFSQDGTPLEPASSPNVVTELERLISEAGGPQLVYNLPWLIHTVGDIHAPLHCVSRDSAAQPKGDLGGNLVIVEPGITLHKLWDDAVGTDMSLAFVDQTAQELAAGRQGDSGNLIQILDPKVWAEESLSVSQKEIYTFGTEYGSREHPVPVAADYRANAHKVSQYQAFKAGIRLAAVLGQWY